MRAAVWGALLCGPLALAAVVAAPRSGSRPSAAPAVSQPVRAGGTESPVGFAELFLSLWLRADAQQADSTTAKALRALAPEVELPSWGQEPPVVDQVVAVRCRPDGGSTWLVTAAAQLRTGHDPATVRYFAVPVLVTGEGPTQQVMVPRAPAEVGAPAEAKPAPSGYSGEVPVNSPLAQTVGDFLAAFLAGGAGVSDRFLAPGVRLPAVSPAPYKTVALERVTAAQGTGEGAVGRDGSVARVLAQVTARDGAGRQWPLAYALRLVARAGRWEVAGFDASAEANGDSVTGASVLRSTAVQLPIAEDPAGRHVLVVGAGGER